MPSQKRRRRANSASNSASKVEDEQGTPAKRNAPHQEDHDYQEQYYEQDEHYEGDQGVIESYNRSETTTKFASELSSGQAPHYKYWAQRCRLFSKYHEGIILDDEGWYSVTPELIADHIAKRIWSSLLQPTTPLHPKKGWKNKKKVHVATHSNAGLLMDAFCGPGGNSIQFALAAPPGGIVFAIDIDPAKAQMARHNASIYGVQSRIEFIVGDSLAIAPHFRADAVFLSPPWGGPDYVNEEEYHMKTLLPVSGEEMHRVFGAITPNLAYLLPRNVVHQEVISLAEKHQTVEIEGNYLTGKLKTVTAYYGALVTRPETSPPIEAHSPLDIDPLPDFIDYEEEEEHQEE